MLSNLVQCSCNEPMKLETIAPGNASDTLLLTMICPNCGSRRRFIFSEIVVPHHEIKLRDTI